jgi:succinoglycan biosynthesis protein ExoL
MTSEGKDAVVEGGIGAHGTLSGLFDQVARRLGKTERSRGAARSPPDKRPLIAYFGPDQRDSAVHRRIAQWRYAGFRVLPFAFSRGAGIDAAEEFVHLGRIEPQSRGRRALPLALAGLRLAAERRLLAEVDLFVARNLDNLLLALLARRVIDATVPVVYEVLDVNPSCTATDWRGALLRRLERWALARADLLVVSSPHFASDYYQTLLRYRRDWFLFENKVPRYAGLSRSVGDMMDVGSARRPPWRIGWFGYLDDQRSWDILRGLAERMPQDVAIVVRGTPYTNFDMVRFAADVARLDNVVYGGPYRNPEDLAEIYDGVDMVWSVDCNFPTANSKWLLTNGIYEAGYFGKPVLGSAGTAVGEFLTRYGSGWSLAEPLDESLVTFIRDLTAEHYREKRRAIAALPTEVFAETDEIDRLWQLLGQRQLRHGRRAEPARRVHTSA